MQESQVGRSPHGERGLKLSVPALVLPPPSRSPHGERGLKFIWGGYSTLTILLSLSSRRAWIEISIQQEY